MKRWETGLLVMAVAFLLLGGFDLRSWWLTGSKFNLVLALLFGAGSLMWLWRARPGRKAG